MVKMKEEFSNLIGKGLGVDESQVNMQNLLNQKTGNYVM